MFANVSHIFGGERALLDSHARKLFAVVWLENSGRTNDCKYLQQSPSDGDVLPQANTNL
jgi:hypothetical protein